MKIQSVEIKNFRKIKNLSFETNNFSILVGDNGTGKTSILEAINYTLSPYFLSGRVKHTDFYNGADDPISIQITFDECFTASLPDGYTTQSVPCNGVLLEIRKREKAAANKAFSDVVVVGHYAIPEQPRNTQGWEIARKSGSPFKFTERSLALAQLDTSGFPKSFYFPKNRERQLQKGFNSSVSSIFDDFNWRFSKAIRKSKEESESFHEKKSSFENQIIEKIDPASFKKCFDDLNEKLADFKIEKVELSFLDGNAPFENAFLSSKFENLDLQVSSLGSGIEMITALMLLETLALLSKEKIIVLIDEPELHLHPQLQEKFAVHLTQLSLDYQTFISTHSPYFFKSCIGKTQIDLLATKNTGNVIDIEKTDSASGLFPWSPTWGEINFIAYNLPTVEFHNELYGFAEADERYNAQLKLLEKSKSRYNEKRKAQENVSLSEYIRHSIHHPENIHNKKYTEEELHQSIQTLIKIVRSPITS